jgi:hypothetical protein
LSYRLRLYPYCGGTTDIIHDDELDVCWLAAARQIHCHREDASQPVTIMGRGVKSELQTSEGAGMIGDGEGILCIEKIMTRCRVCGDRFSNGNATICNRCLDDDPSEDDDFDDHEGDEEEE